GALTLEAPGDPHAQAWVADLLAPWMQRTAASVVLAWLGEVSPDAHLYIAGEEGTGRTSLAATLARRAMASRPTPPDYCYVPDPEALGRSMLLTLPTSTAIPFTDLLESALRQLAQDWAKLPVGAANDDGPEGAHETDSPPHEVGSSPLARYFAPARAVAPRLARAYLERLREALEALLGTPFPPAMSDASAPAGRVRAPATEADGVALGAPVLVSMRGQQDIAHALLRANGGVLILPADELLERDQPSAAWATLRAALRSGELAVRGPGAPAIPLTLRVALIGTDLHYRKLRVFAEDFERIFRYNAALEANVEWADAGPMAYQAEAAYAALAAGVAHRYQVPPLDPSGIARLVEEGARRVGGRNRSYVTAELTILRDLIVEAGRKALTTTGATTTGATTSREHLEAILETRRVWQGHDARLYREHILANREIVPTSGVAVGQINGLGVYSPPPLERRFAVPFRISATVSPGRERLVDIEREAEASDSSHISGALTMAGYFARRYGSQRPISMVARLRFEQGEGTNGSSASAGALFALLSALGEVPLTCSRAITGAVGQYGEVQTIGGVNEKIEGFWAICQARRAAGERPALSYGVLIPAANAQDLMLRREVAESIAHEGWFSIWPISTIDEGIPLLTGLPAEDAHARVDRRLQRFYELGRASTSAQR
ncbi:MAG: AAA family ATPase, partial [Ktedonobacterales bacterium]|nr:AAA family ATPase [Ktedonobacterales bacterium]